MAALTWRYINELGFGQENELPGSSHLTGQAPNKHVGEILFLSCEYLSVNTLQGPALSCTGNKWTVIASSHNTHCLLLPAHSSLRALLPFLFPSIPAMVPLLLRFCKQRCPDPALCAECSVDGWVQGPGEARNAYEKLFLILLKV